MLRECYKYCMILVDKKLKNEWLMLIKIFIFVRVGGEIFISF